VIVLDEEIPGSQYPFSPINPNRVMQAPIAAFAGSGIPFLYCTETHEMGENSSLPPCAKSIFITG
jgi:hypothetical protein